VLAVTIPSSALAVWLTGTYESAQGNRWALAAIGGMLAAAVGMMVAAAWLLVRPHLSSRTWLRTLVLVAVPAVLALKFSVPPVQVLAAAAVAAWLWPAAEQA
jgi:chromate transport protein ChrA